MFLLGHGSSGKSVTMKLTQAAIGNYFKKFGSDALERKNTGKNKIFNTLDDIPYALIVWINEMSDSLADGSLLKQIVEGQTETTKLYKDGSFDIKFKAKFLVTANTMPAIPIDTGTARRIVAAESVSKFTDNVNEVNEAKYIYKMDKDLLHKLTTHAMLNAWIDVLLGYCKQIAEGKEPKLTANVRNATSSVVCANDHVQDFIDELLIVTNNADDRIGKETIMKLFKAKFPTKYITMQQLISDLKEKHINYDSQLRTKTSNVRGCFTSIKIKDDDDDEEDAKVEKASKEVCTNLFLHHNNQTLEKENEELKKRVAELEALVKQLQQPKVEEKKEIDYVELDRKALKKHKEKKEKKTIKKVHVCLEEDRKHGFCCKHDEVDEDGNLIAEGFGCNGDDRCCEHNSEKAEENNKKVAKKHKEKKGQSPKEEKSPREALFDVLDSIKPKKV